MSKWMGGILTTLIVLALTSLVGALMKGPIDEFSSGERIQAQVQLSPWVDKPEEEEKSASVDPDDLSYKEILDNLLDDLTNSGSSDYGVARVSLENNGSSVVQHINFRLTAPYGEFDYLIIDSKGESSKLLRGNRVSLPDMRPGDRIAVFMWGSFSSYLFPDKFRTYSSKGSFRTSFDWPQTEEYVYKSWIGHFLDEYAWKIFIFAVLFIVGLSLIYVGVYSEYVKHLMKDEEFAQAERSRFVADEKKFEPDFVGKGLAKESSVNETA